eukprot:CAMPEP_0198142468 /NCGR_PEP_ID=MMETSP1443-20131203/5247_1 /TAXON_ID=186043 /ORGANISM="Entomoneis sp., Strain CCMP2396" /LENGTH=506 /DNA_ID=CAMNT_0043805483 /DNA_START=308 /DNA_END=1828 /DNA_ORIENTATION=-
MASTIPQVVVITPPKEVVKIAPQTVETLAHQAELEKFYAQHLHQRLQHQRVLPKFTITSSLNNTRQSNVTAFHFKEPPTIVPKKPSSPGSHLIPRRIIFTHNTNLMDPQTADPKERARFLPNIIRTLEVYSKTLWKSSNVDLWFLNNTDCLSALRRVEPRLIRHFKAEKEGKYKGDVCRLAALYLAGGYYIDVDMKALRPVILKANTTFASVQSNQGFFNAFTAAQPGHSIVYHSLQIMLRYYQNRTTDQQWSSESYYNSYDYGMMPERYSMYRPPPSEEDTIILKALQRIRSVGLNGPFSLEAAYQVAQLRQHQGNRTDDLKALRTSDEWAEPVMEERPSDEELENDFHNDPHNPNYYEYDSDDSPDFFDSRGDSIAAGGGDNNVKEKLQPVASTELLLEGDFHTQNGNRRKQFPHLPYQDEGVGPNCNFVVHDNTTVYFFARIVGTDLCDFPSKDKTKTTHNSRTSSLFASSRAATTKRKRKQLTLPPNVKLFHVKMEPQTKLS